MPSPSNKALLSFLCLALLSVAAGASGAQTRSETTSTAEQKDYLLIGAGDLVSVTVFREPDLASKSRVDALGNISLPLIGSIHVQGSTPQQAQKLVAADYEAAHYLKSPQVSLIVEEYATQSISIVGEVQKAGAYPATAPRSVIDAIAFAGGFTPVADRHVTIQHRGYLNGKEEVFLSNDSDRALAAQVMVYPGDIVMAPKRESSMCWEMCTSLAATSCRTTRS